MSASPGSWLKESATKIAIWVALVAFSLGFPRFLVVCSGPEHDAQLEFVHARGSCCGHAHHPGDRAATRTGTDSGGEVAGTAHGGCLDLALGLGFGPVPQRIGIAPILAATAFAVPCFAPAAPSLADRGERPPSTGPPRIDRRTSLRSSTLLLL